jgi:hypothetical protein
MTLTSLIRLYNRIRDSGYTILNLRHRPSSALAFTLEHPANRFLKVTSEVVSIKRKKVCCLRSSTDGSATWLIAHIPVSMTFRGAVLAEVTGHKRTKN